MFGFDVVEREGWEGVKVSGSSVLGFISEGFSEIVRILFRGRILFLGVFGVLKGFLIDFLMDVLMLVYSVTKY